MAKYWMLMAHYDAETQTFSAAAGALAASPYMPPEDARLVGLRVIPGGEAATSLVRGLHFRLSSTSFSPNAIEVFGEGNGLQTAPMLNAPVIDYQVDQQVKSGVKVAIEGRNETATAVTVSCFIMGYFDNGKQ